MGCVNPITDIDLKPLGAGDRILLVLLEERKHRLSPAAELIELLWPDPDLEPEWSEVSLRVRIYRLRKKLKEQGFCIVSVRGSRGGYRLERTA